MTQVRIHKPVIENKSHPISEIIVGSWYIITEYKGNPQYVGEFGIGFYDGEYRGIVTPSGYFFCNKNFIVKKLSSVDISYKE